MVSASSVSSCHDRLTEIPILTCLKPQVLLALASTSAVWPARTILQGFAPWGPIALVASKWYICFKNSVALIPSPTSSPKPNLPTPEEYEPPSPPSQRDLGPPPPGYGRYADFDRGFNSSSGGGGGGPASGFVPRRNLEDVMCFKCGERGHYANHCTRKNVPGNRGGIDRSSRYNED